MRRFVVPHAFGTLALLLALGGCGGDAGTQGNANALTSLDTRLTEGATPSPVAVPARHYAPDADGKSVLAAHNAIMAADESAEGERAGARRAAASFAAAKGRAVGGCAGRDLRYGDRWASALPEGLGLYPGAHLVEAAGTDTGRCALRVVSFTTADSPQAVAAHYGDSVRKAGFDAERQPCRNEVRMGGTRARDDAAYMLFARRTARGLTEVDIIASAGPTA